MPAISKQVIKKIIKKYVKAKITDDGAEAIAALLEKKAKEISKYAVKSAASEKRNRIIKKDISSYVLKEGD
jgi:histone H3/H4